MPFNVIALWLGHESANTTHRYVEADLAMKEKALARLKPPDTKLRRFRASDSLMKFLSAWEPVKEAGHASGGGGPARIRHDRSLM